MPALTAQDVTRFRSVVARRLGLHYDDLKLDYLADVLRGRLLATVTRSDVYLDNLAQSPNKSGELRALAEELTVNETFFFRNTDNFRALAECVFVERARQRAGTRQLRILSAGCASGEEPYSLAILLRETLADFERWDVKIWGVDLSPSMLQKAAEARYSSWSLRATSEDLKRRYFRPEGRDFVLDPKVQRMVTFDERNLAEEDASLWQPCCYDVVLCRNVVMYFTPDVLRDVIRRITNALVPGGFLFLGHAETLRGLTQEYHLCHTHDTFYYQKRDAVPFAPRAWPNASLGAGYAGNTQLNGVTPEVIDTTTSWVDAIQHASERIARLSSGSAHASSAGPVHEPQADSLEPAAAPPASASAPPVKPSWDLALVLEATRQERFADALALLSALPPESHAEPDTLLLRATLLINSGRLEEAQVTCTSLLELDDLNAGAHYVMALCREHAGELTQAIEYDRTAVYLDPSFAMPRLHLGLMARRSGDTFAAKQELGQALLLLAQEDASRLLMFGGGFSRSMLLGLCRTELRASGGER